MHKKIVSLFISVMLLTTLTPFNAFAESYYEVYFVDENGSKISSTFQVAKGDTVNPSDVPALPQGIEGYEAYVADDGGKNHSTYSWDIDPYTKTITSNTVFTRIRETEKHDYNFGKPQFTLKSNDKSGLMALYECSKCGNVGEVGVEIGEIRGTGMSIKVDASAIGGDSTAYTGTLDVSDIGTIVNLMQKVGVPIPGWVNTVITVIDKVDDVVDTIVENQSTCKKRGYHIYGEPTFAWNSEYTSCTATFECTEEGCHTDYDGHYVNVDVSKNNPEYTTASCTEIGSVKYSGYVMFDRNDGSGLMQYNNEKVVKLSDALGHNYTDSQFNYNDDCEKNGYITSVCTRCGDTKVVEKPDSARGHSLVTVQKNVVPSTCTSEGSYDEVTYCINCKKEFLSVTKTIEKKAHTPLPAVTEIIKTADCTENGAYKQVTYCAVCDEKIEESAEIMVPAKGHTEYYVYSSEEAPTCTSSGKYTRTKYCSVCNEQLSDPEEFEISTTSHNIVTSVVEPTCSEPGYTIDKCINENCTYSLIYNQKPATGEHNYQIITNTKPTCTTDGVIVERCALCHDVKTTKGTPELSATGHIPDDGKITVQPTCTTEGLLEYKCIVCNEVTSTVTIPATGHKLDYTVLNKASCTTGGYTEKFCTNSGCDYSEITDLTESLGHDPAEAMVENNVEPTCTTDGSYDLVVRCQRDGCGEIIISSHVVKPALGHKYYYTDEEYDSTCTVQGYKDFKCSKCNSEFSGEYKDLLPHALTKTEAKPATCTESGNNDYYTCSECLNVFSDEDGEKATSIAAETIPALGHTMIKTEAKPASCTEDGTNEYYTCSTCNNVYADDTGNVLTSVSAEVLKAHGHTPTPVTAVAPTCTTSGLTEGSVCSVCNAVLVAQTTVDALGHDYDEGVITVQPTITSKGVKTYTCKRCGDTRTEELAPITLEEATPSDDAADKAVESASINKPKNIATLSNFKQNRILITFDEVKGAQNYRVMYRKAGTKKWNYEWTDGQTFYYLKNLKSHGLYEFMFAAYKKNANNEWERGAYSVTSYRYYYKENIKKVKAGKKSIKVTWTKDKSGNGYELFYATKKDMSDRKRIVINSKNSTSYTIKKLKSGKKYYIRVRSIKKKGGKSYTGEFSSQKNVKVK